MADDIKVNHCHDWPTFVEIQLQKIRQYAAQRETENGYLKRDRWNGWFAAGLLLLVLMIVLYQWLVAGAGLYCPLPG